MLELRQAIGHEVTLKGYYYSSPWCQLLSGNKGPPKLNGKFQKYRIHKF